VVLDRVSGLWMLCAIGGLGAAACAQRAGALAAPARRRLFASLLLAGTALWLALPWALPCAARPAPAGRRLAGAAARWRRRGRTFVGNWAGRRRPRRRCSCCRRRRWRPARLALGVRQPIAVWAWAIAPVFLMAALPLSVGGWGTREAAAVAALAPFGVAAPAAVGVAVVYGLYGLAQGALGALAFGLPRNTTK
jgi:hypothetical protein